ncbi:MAG: hypothetical protein ACYTEW_26350, partial [Planctomycetota bacterium]
MGVDIVQLPSDTSNTGKRLYAITETLSGNTVYFEVHGLVDSSGNVVSTASPLPVEVVSGAVVVNSGLEIIWRGGQVSGTVAISGSLTASVSGETVTVASGVFFASGIGVTTGLTVTSGTFTMSSGVGVIADISGETVTTRPDGMTKITGNLLQIDGGGTTLSTVAGNKFIIKNNQGNNTMWIA